MKNLFTNPHGNENVINEIAVKGTSLHNYQHFKSMLNNVFFSLFCVGVGIIKGIQTNGIR